MRARSASPPFLKLGQTLKGWRKRQFKSVRSLFEAGPPFSFGLSVYGDYERGTVLPSLTNYVEILDFFEKDLAEGVLVWLEVQLGEKAHRVREGFEKEVKKVSPLSLDETWVFDQEDARLVQRNPDLWPTLARICSQYPAAIPTPRGRGFKSAFDLWAKKGHLEIKDGKVRVLKPQLHVPETPALHGLRNLNFSQTAKTLTDQMDFEQLRLGQSFRKVLGRPMNRRDRERWVAKLAQLQEEFMGEEYEVGSESCVLLLALGNND